MIQNVMELEEKAVLRAEVAVVGAGLAGIDVARYLGDRGVRVVLLESGRLEFDPSIQDLARVSFVGKPLRTHETHSHISGYLPPMYRGYCRIRQFGGTTNVWTGKWRIFDPWDFERRSWIPHSGWPIALDDLLPYYEETARDYGFGDFEAEARGEFFRNASYFLAPHGLVPHLDYWEKTPTRSGSRFFQELKQSANVDVILGANATEILLDGSLRTVRGIQFKSLDLRCFMLHADRFVLAAGGLEMTASSACVESSDRDRRRQRAPTRRTVLHGPPQEQGTEVEAGSSDQARHGRLENSAAPSLRYELLTLGRCSTGTDPAESRRLSTPGSPHQIVGPH